MTLMKRSADVALRTTRSVDRDLAPAPTHRSAGDSPLPPACGIFEAHFNNRKRRRRGQTLEYFDVYGALFPDGRVILNTNRLPRTGFRSLSACREYLESVGDVRLVWVAMPCETARDLSDDLHMSEGE